MRHASPVTHTYDPFGNLARIVETYPGGQLNDRTIVNSYDGADRLTAETIRGNRPATTTYAYDRAHNRTLRSVHQGTATKRWRYAHADGLNRLDYAWIDANNDQTWTSGEARRDYTYGNIGAITAIAGSQGETIDQEFTYDPENRLLAVTAATTSGDSDYTYAYDYRTRRVLRDESAAGGTATKLSFSGGLSAQEYDDGASTPSVEYIRGSDYGGGVGGILYTLRSGTPSFKHFNARGDVVAATNASGSLTYQAAFDAFGRHGGTPSSERWGLKKSANLQRQHANTKDEDPWGALNEGYRYRLLEEGLFLTPDPLGFVDGPNLYAYVTQNPWTKFDPLGLKTIEDYDQEIETYDKEIETYNNQRRELREKGKENWSHDDQMNFTRAGLKVMGRALKKEKAEKARNSIFESARNIKEKLGVAIDPLSIDDDDKHYKSVRNALNTISWVPGSSTAYNVNKGDWKGAGKSFATEVALTYLGGKLLQKAFGPAAGSVDELTTVSRWGRLGLKDGDFVMQGNANWWNWIKSGKWQRGMGNQYAPLKSGQEFVVPKSSILPPSQASTAHPIADQGIIGWYKKTILGQRSYKK